MKEVLIEIRDELKYHTQLLESIFHNKDQSGNAGNMIRKNLERVQEQIKKHPAFQANPEMAAATISMMKILGGANNEQ